MKQLLSLLLCSLLGNSAVLAQASAKPQAKTPGITFRNFTGTCQGIGKTERLKEFVGWERDDVYWAHLEPKPGEWDQAKLEEWGRKVLALREQGINFLPILCYSAPWAVDRTPRTLTYSDGRRVEFKVEENEGRAITSRQNEKGEWTVESDKPVKIHPLMQLGADHVAAWEAYVRRVVSFLSAPPYNIRYFQIWNEAHTESGFWRYGEDLDVYLQRVHLPAAKIVHELGGKVVYGGWPCCGSIEDYVALLDRRNTWKTVDVFDLHYFPVSAFEYLHRAAKKRGLGSISIWQTEIGFTTVPGTIGNDYPRFLDWCLRHDWNEPDKYKLFWFSAFSPDDVKAYGYRCGLLLGDKFSPHGLTLKTLGALLSPGSLGLYKGAVETVPVLRSEMDERKSSVEAFTVGDSKIVVAVHLVQNNDAKIFTDWNGNLNTIHLDFGNPMLRLNLPELRTKKVASVSRVDPAGTRRALVPGAASTLSLEVPICDDKESASAKWIQTSTARTFFVEIVLK